MNAQIQKFVFSFFLICPVAVAVEPPPRPSTPTDKAHSHKPGVSKNEQSPMKMDLNEGLEYFIISALEGPSSQRGWILVDKNGSYEVDFDTPKELIKYFRDQSPKRQRKGILIWGSLTHLKDVEKSKPQMTDYRKERFADAAWLEEERRFVSKLANACKESSIDLWINTDLGTKGIEFINLVRNR